MKELALDCQFGKCLIYKDNEMDTKLKILFQCPNIRPLRKMVSRWRVHRLNGRILPSEVIIEAEGNNEIKHKLVKEYIDKDNERFRKAHPMMESIMDTHYRNFPNVTDIYEDMVFCLLAYGFQPDEYLFFELKDKGVEERESYVSDIERIIYFMQMNDICEGETFLNKSKTYQLYKKYYKRDAIAINKRTQFSEFESFVKKHPIFVKKRVDLYKGDGVELVNSRNLNVSLNQYFEQLKSTDLFQLEEKIQQSDIMASLNASSVNTIRCNAFVTRHGVKVPFAFLKVGRAGSFVDNGGKGGILVGIDEKTGVLNTDGRDEYGNRYVTHPDSNIRFQDFRLPDWEDALQLCNEITPKVTGVQAIGWDLAHTAQGWVIVEGNLFSQFVGPQITREQGLKKEWLAVMEDMELL